MDNLVIETKNLSKAYGSKYALSNLNIQIKEGEIYGLLGPNGSGKSTLMRILAGLSIPTFGTVKVLGFDVVADNLKIKELVGFIPEVPVLYESLTPIEYFDFIAAMRKLDKNIVFGRVHELVTAFELNEYLNDFIGSLSFGTKQKIAIIGTLLHNPKLIIMDEVMNGLDPKSARILKDLIKSFSNQGKTVIFSTHILEIVENICDRVTILKDGTMVAEGNVKDLRNIVSGSLESLFFKVTGESNFEAIINAISEKL
ncbi:MAG: ABC transporter ATP-binding protein [Thermoplasmata archaeon]